MPTVQLLVNQMCRMKNITFCEFMFAVNATCNE